MIERNDGAASQKLMQTTQSPDAISPLSMLREQLAPLTQEGKFRIISEYEKGDFGIIHFAANLVSGPHPSVAVRLCRSENGPTYILRAIIVRADLDTTVTLNQVLLSTIPVQLNNSVPITTN